MVITLMAKTLTLYSVPIRAVSPNASRMAMPASSRGMPAATTAPKTISRMNMAAGMPKISARPRSEAESCMAALPILASPVCWIVKPPLWLLTRRACSLST